MVFCFTFTTNLKKRKKGTKYLETIQILLYLVLVKTKEILLSTTADIKLQFELLLQGHLYIFIPWVGINHFY